MPVDAAEALINLGGLGAALVAMGWYVLRRETSFQKQIDDLRSQLNVVQEARVADALKVADRIVAIVEKQHDVLGGIERVMEVQTGLLDRVRDAVERGLPPRGNR